MRRIRAKRPVAVIGYGSQGRAQALRLRQAGLEVVVGLRGGSRSRARARRQGFRVGTPRQVVANAAAVVVLVPDQTGRRVLRSLVPVLAADALVVFAAGYPLVFGSGRLPAHNDIVLVAPHGPGSDLARGVELSGFVGVAVDATGRALARARRYAQAIGLGPLYTTTPAEEALGDLFGEQALVCGGLVGLTAAVARVMQNHNLPAANAYFETIAQLDRLAALLKQRGVQGFWREISDCAAHGMARAAPHLFDLRFERKLEETWQQIASGRYSRAFQAGGRPRRLPDRFRVLESLERAGKKKGRP